MPFWGIWLYGEASRNQTEIFDKRLNTGMYSRVICMIFKEFRWARFFVNQC